MYSNIGLSFRETVSLMKACSRALNDWQTDISPCVHTTRTNLLGRVIFQTIFSLTHIRFQTGFKKMYFVTCICTAKRIDITKRPWYINEIRCRFGSICMVLARQCRSLSRALPPNQNVCHPSRESMGQF